MQSRRVAVAAFVAVFVVWQVGVPLLGLFGPRPGRFGWQMYSAFPAPPQAWIIFADGREEQLDLDHLFAVRRAEIDYASALRAGLCGMPRAAGFRLVFADADSEMIRCV